MTIVIGGYINKVRLPFWKANSESDVLQAGERRLSLSAELLIPAVQENDREACSLELALVHKFFF